MDKTREAKYISRIPWVRCCSYHLDLKWCRFLVDWRRFLSPSFSIRYIQRIKYGYNLIYNFVFQILNPLTSPTIVTSNQRGAQTVVSNQQQHIRQPLQNGRTSHPTNVAQSASTHSHGRPTLTTQSLKRNSVTSSEEPEYILPDSTMTEISLQVIKFFYCNFCIHIKLTK